MKAVVVEEFGPPESLAVAERPDPVAGLQEVVVDIRAAGVNFPDLLVVEGSYQILPDRPFSPGKEIAGVVVETGEGVDPALRGRRVMAQVEFGGYAERLAVPTELIVPIPEAVDFDVAAGLGLGSVTAHFALRRRAGLRAGETVLVTGAGGVVGAATVQLAKAWGARVIGAVRGADRAELVRSLGADHIVDPDPATMRDAVRELTDGRGADVAVELVGGDVFAQTLRSMAWEGRLVVGGFASGEVPVIKAGHILVKNIAVTGLQVSDYRDRDPALFTQALAELLDLVSAGDLRIPLAGTFDLSEAPRVLRGVASGELKGKAVLRP